MTSSVVFTDIQDRFDYSVLSSSIPSSNYNLGNQTELDALKEILTESILVKSMVFTFILKHL
jgi:hypothetical protein